VSLDFHRLRVSEVSPLTDDAVAVTFDVPPELAEAFRYLPGQHMTLRALIDGRDVRRSYSICSNANGGKLRVGIKRLPGGAFSSFATADLAAGDVVEKPRSAVPFAYRRSGLEGNVVLGCTLLLTEAPVERVRADMNFVLKKRRDGTPFDQPCCGSVFKNPDIMTAGRLIDRCGLRGRRVGGAEISALHANYIVNRGGASADDVLKLIDIARTAVFKEFGLELDLEVKVLGDPK